MASDFYESGAAFDALSKDLAEAQQALAAAHSQARKREVETYAAHKAEVAAAQTRLMQREAEYAKVLKELHERSAELKALKAEFGRVHDGVLRRLENMPVTPKELAAVLRLVTPETEWWRAMHALILDQVRMETDALCVANITSEMAHVNRGRLAGLRDFQGALLQHMANAQRDGQ